MSAITDDELFALAMVLAELLASIQMRFDADAAKIAERDAEIARLKVEREDRREDKREMRDEIAKLRAVAEAARVVKATLNAEDDALWYTPIGDDGEPCEEQPNYNEAWERMTAALAALDDKGAT